MNHPITERQREVLQLVQRGSTMRQICKALGVVSTNSANCHIQALIAKGAIEDVRGFGCPSRWRPTPYGLILLGLAPCPTCKGCGTVTA